MHEELVFVMAIYCLCRSSFTLELNPFSLFSVSTEKFRFSAEFIEMRCQALHVFINRIASHPDLKQSEDLRTFLQEDEEVNFSRDCLF